MAPDPGGDKDTKRTVGCNFDSLVPDERHKAAIRDAVTRTHKATILATELLNLHIRRSLEERGGAGFEHIFSANWLLNAYNEVTVGRGSPKVIADLHETKERFMPAFEPVDRKGLTQILMYECRNLATVATNNVWMHFQKRLLSHVRRALKLGDAAYTALSKDEKRKRRLHFLQIAEDLARPPSEPFRSPSEHHPWIALERLRLRIDAAVGEWKGKSLLYHLKCHPERFLESMRLLSSEKEADGGAAFSLFSLRRTLVPRHIRFDQKALRELLSLGVSEFQKQAAKRRKSEAGRVDLEAGPSKRERRDKADMLDEKAQAFGEVLDLRAANVSQRRRFDFAFTTDGVSARLQCSVPKTKKEEGGKLTSMPSRGIHAIDELKRVSRLAELHVVGIDPGIREMIVAVDQDDPKDTSPVRLQGIHKKGDKRQLVLAYGAWGATDGASCVKKGNPPTIGVSLMRKLSKRFVVSLTPEHGTSKTCCKCLGRCGPWKELEEKMDKKVRGLRICQDEGCKLPQNRDRTGASNIGLNFCRLFRGESPIRTMTNEEREFHRLNVGCCVACDAE